jgi:rhodanese-related sulfurtransferase
MKSLLLTRRRVSLGLGLATLTIMGAFNAHAQSGLDADSVTLDVARKEHESGRVTLIDIREPQEHATGVAAGAQLLPMRQLAARLAEIPNDPKRPVLLICNTQNRSSATFKFLRDKGYTNVRFVQGGMSEWVRRGWPLVKP